MRRSRTTERVGVVAMMTALFMTVGFGDDGKPAFKIQKQVLIQPFLTGEYHVVVDLGELPVGSKGIVELELVNQLEISFPVKNLEIRCNCAAARLSVSEIKSQSSAKLELMIETPKSARRADDSIVVAIKSSEGNDRDISLAAKYKLAGLMCFVDRMFVQEVNPRLERQSILVPFLLTRPVVADDIELVFTPRNDGIVAKIVEVDEKTYVEIVVDPVFIPEEGLTLSLSVRSQRVPFSDELTLTLLYPKEFTISPRTIRFRAVDDRLVANCMARDRQYKGKPAAEAVPNIEASIGECKLKVECTRLGSGIYRVQLSGDEKRLSDEFGDDNADSPKVSWHILTRIRAFHLESPASLISPSVPSTSD